MFYSGWHLRSSVLLSVQNTRAPRIPDAFHQVQLAFMDVGDAVLYTMHAPAQCFAGHRTNVFIAGTYVYVSTGASVLYYVSHFDVVCCVLFVIIL